MKYGAQNLHRYQNSGYRDQNMRKSCEKNSKSKPKEVTLNELAKQVQKQISTLDIEKLIKIAMFIRSLYVVNNEDKVQEEEEEEEADL